MSTEMIIFTVVLHMFLLSIVENSAYLYSERIMGLFIYLIPSIILSIFNNLLYQ